MPKSMTIIEIIQRGEGKWSRYHDEFAAAWKQAEQILLDAKEPIDYRSQLLSVMFQAKYHQGGYDEALSHADESL